jgi:hypothetical protein
VHRLCGNAHAHQACEHFHQHFAILPHVVHAFVLAKEMRDGGVMSLDDFAVPPKKETLEEGKANQREASPFFLYLCLHKT